MVDFVSLVERCFSLLEGRMKRIALSLVGVAAIAAMAAMCLVVHTATQSIYRAFGTTTNDWVQVWP